MNCSSIKGASSRAPSSGYPGPIPRAADAAQGEKPLRERRLNAQRILLFKTVVYFPTAELRMLILWSPGESEDEGEVLNDELGGDAFNFSFLWRSPSPF